MSVFRTGNTMHEGLRNYLYGPVAPQAAVGPPAAPSARQPVTPTPASSIPGAPTPIKSSSASVRKTNVQIPVARVAVHAIPEGEIVVTDHRPHYNSSSIGADAGAQMQRSKLGEVEVFTLEQANDALLSRLSIRGLGDAATTNPVYEAVVQNAPPEWIALERAAESQHFPRLDGVVNNSDVDSEDLYESYSSACQVNVAVQGPCRILNDEARRCDDSGNSHSTLYVGLVRRLSIRKADLNKSGGGVYDLDDESDVQEVMKSEFTTVTYKFERFSSTMLISGKYSLGKRLSDQVGTTKLTDKLAHVQTFYGQVLDPYLRYFEDGNVFGYDELIGASVLGRVLDTKQSPNMMTVHVSIRPLGALTVFDNDPNNLYYSETPWEEDRANAADPTIKRAVGHSISVAEQLHRLWVYKNPI